jgi:hypothetical protein
MSSDGYKQRREEEMRWVLNNNELLYGFFGRKAESIREVQSRLNQQLRLTEVNKMKSEIAELRATTN